MALKEDVDDLLSLIPFNGNKTVVGLAVGQLFPLVVAIFPPAAVAAPFISALATFFTTIGLLHKTAK